MKKVIIEDETSAINYLEKVLKEWDSWRDHHIYLVQAVEILLKSNKNMTKYINSLHRQMESFERSKR